MKFSIALILVAAVASTQAVVRHRPTRDVNMMSSAELNSALNAKFLEQKKVRQSLAVMDSINDNVSRLEQLVNDKEDPDWKTLSLELLTKLQNPVNGLLLSWNDWWLANNAAGYTPKWDPEHNPAHMIKSEVSDVYKAMTKIRALEARLKNDKSSGTTNEDWNLLNSLKREVGIPVEFSGDKSSLAGQGSVQAKSMASFY